MRTTTITTRSERLERAAMLRSGRMVPMGVTIDSVDYESVSAYHEAMKQAALVVERGAQMIVVLAEASKEASGAL